MVLPKAYQEIEMDITKMSYEQLQEEILFNNNGLYEMFDEQRFLNNDYTLEELIEITSNWVIAGDECYN